MLNEAVVEMFRQVSNQLDRALGDVSTTADPIEGLLTRMSGYDGTDPDTTLAIEGYLAAGRHPELRDQLSALLDEFRESCADRLNRLGVPAPEATATVLLPALDGLVLQRGLGSFADPDALTRVLRRLVGAPGRPADSAAGGTEDTTRHRPGKASQ